MSQMCCYHQHACILVCLSLLSAALSVKLQWMIQVTREIHGNSEFKGSGHAVSNNLNYDSSLKFVSLSQSYPKILNSS